MRKFEISYDTNISNLGKTVETIELESFNNSSLPTYI